MDTDKKPPEKEPRPDKYLLKRDFSQIPNPILDLITGNTLPESQKRVLGRIARLTFGYHVKTSLISIGRLERECHLKHRTVEYALGNLEAEGIITVSRHSTHVNKIGVNPRQHEWLVQRKSKQYQKLLTAQRKRSRELVQGLYERILARQKGKSLVQGSTSTSAKSFAPSKQRIKQKNLEFLFSNLPKSKKRIAEALTILDYGKAQCLWITDNWTREEIRAAIKKLLDRALDTLDMGNLGKALVSVLAGKGIPDENDED